MRRELRSPCNVAFCPRLPGYCPKLAGSRDALAVPPGRVRSGGEERYSVPSDRARQGVLSQTMQLSPMESPSSSDARAGRHAGTVPACLMRGGRMGELMRSLDWTGTRLGAPETWPQSLRTSISICLDCH